MRAPPMPLRTPPVVQPPPPQQLGARGRTLYINQTTMRGLHLNLETQPIASYIGRLQWLEALEDNFRYRVCWRVLLHTTSQTTTLN